jgi:hypothetical protein
MLAWMKVKADLLWGIAITVVVGVISVIVAGMIYRKSASRRQLDGVHKDIRAIRAAVQRMREAPPWPERIWGVPIARNRYFTGRRDLLAQLRASLSDRRVVAMYGLGGVGKTQIALEYCFEYGHEYHVVWWVRAEEIPALTMDLAALGSKLGLDDSRGAGATASAAKAWLEQHRDWLLVLDNAQSPSEVAGYIPSVGTGHVIITTRHPDWVDVLPLHVEDMLPEEAVAFLLKRTERVSAGGAPQLTGDLGYLPLALEQAGAYMLATGLSFIDYAALYRQSEAAMMSRGGPLIGYNKTVVTTWGASLEKAVAEAPFARDLLGICAFLAPEDIPTAHLVSAAENEVSFRDAVAALHRYSLVDLEDGALTIHRLVQSVVRGGLNEERTSITMLCIDIPH